MDPIQQVQKDIKETNERLSKYKEQAKNIFDARVSRLNTTGANLSSAETAQRDDAVPDTIQKEYDVCILYSENTGNAVQSDLVKELNNLGLHLTSVAFSPHQLMSSDIQELIYKSRVVVVLITLDALKIQGLLRAIEIARNVKVLLVHHFEKENPFPLVSEQPASIQDLFHEKAITYLPEFSDSVAKAIHEHVVESETNKRTQKRLSTDIHPEIFLSHKRATGQAIAGRLYESLITNFDVFLDSEAQFNLKELDTIISKCSYLILILTEGFLTSDWCIREVRSAIKFQKPIIIVRHYLYKPPAKLPDNLNDVEFLLETCPMIEWMAEFNTPSTSKLREILGYASDKALAALPSFLASQSLYPYLKTGFTIQHPLNVKAWKHELGQLIMGLRVYFNCKVEAIDFDDLEAHNEHFAHLVDIQYVSLKNGTKLNDSSLKMLAEKSPHLKQLHLEGATGAKNLSDDGLNYIIESCKELTHLELCGISRLIKPEGIAKAVHNLPALTHLAIRRDFTPEYRQPLFIELANSKITHLILEEYYAAMMLDILAKGIEDKENKFPDKRGTIKLKELSVRGCSYFTNDQVNTIVNKLGEDLTSLDLGMLKDCKITDEALKSVASA